MEILLSCLRISRAEWVLAAHFASYALSGESCFVIAMNRGIFFFILDLIATFFDALIDVLLPAALRFIAAPPDRKEEDRVFSGVKVLVEPHFRRNKDAARLPVDSLDRFAFLPHERVAVAL